MGIITIQEHTTKYPLQLIGEESGVCWGADTSNPDKNRKRGIDCIKSNHGRTLEYPQVYIILDEYSARVIREFYTHIGGNPSRLQASTRYINYETDGFKFVTPPYIKNTEAAYEIYCDAMDYIQDALVKLERMGDIPREDMAMLLPLGMQTKVVCRTNLRNLIDMSRQRMCMRAYWEFRQLMRDIYKALSDYSEEWSWIVHETFKPKCAELGYCTEKNGCGRRRKKDESDGSNTYELN